MLIWLYNVCLHKKNIPKLAVFHDFQSHVRFLANRNVKIYTTFQETVHVPPAKKRHPGNIAHLSKVCNNSKAIDYKPKKSNTNMWASVVSEIVLNWDALILTIFFKLKQFLLKNILKKILPVHICFRTFFRHN